MSHYTLYIGDNLQVLKSMPDASVDSVVTDPPYGLSREPDMAEVLRHWLAGDDYTHTGGGFMGKTWDSFVPGPALWREVFRVLKPGGHVLAFFGTRTYDLGVIAMRLAGFEVRDQIGWAYASGFPKSLDVSKAIDKAAGAEREVVGVINRSPAGSDDATQSGGRNYRMGGEQAVTMPATNAARQWQGWGTALKPAWEPIVVARKPLQGTVAENVLKHGTGALNIDACRVPTNGEAVPVFDTAGGRKFEQAQTQPDRSTRQVGSSEAGRWPANVIHDGSEEVLAAFPQAKRTVCAHCKGAGCDECDGLGYIDTGSAARFFQQFKGGYNEVWQDLNLPPESANTAEQSSSRQRQAAASALVLAVNSALPEGLLCSGLSLGPSTTATGNELRLIADSVTQAIRTIEPRFWLGSRPARLSLSLNHASVAVSLEQTGTMTITASRLKSDGFAEDVTFNITPTSLEAGGKDCVQSTDGKRFIYCAKASKRDRDEGLEGFAKTSGGMVSNTSGQHMTRRDEGYQVAPRANIHPTVKPTDLMRYLCRLVTPPGGVVLDVCAGSGSTGKAAIMEGFHPIMIELDQDSDGNPAGYAEIIRARCDWAVAERERLAEAERKAARQAAEATAQRDLFAKP